MSSRRLRPGLDCHAINWPRLESPAPGKGAPPPASSSAAAPDLPQESESEWQRRVQEARQAGFQEGEQQARRALQAEVDDQVKRLASALASLSVFRSQLRHDTERELLELAVAIARRILRREVTVDPGVLAGIARSALSRLDQRDRCSIAVAPALRPLLTQALAPYESAQLTVEEDASLQPGDLELRTARGVLDAGIESQLQEIERGLADRLSPPAARA